MVDMSLLLHCFAGSVELVDVSAELPELKYKPGLTKWKVIQFTFLSVETLPHIITCYYYTLH